MIVCVPRVAEGEVEDVVALDVVAHEPVAVGLARERHPAVPALGRRRHRSGRRDLTGQGAVGHLEVGRAAGGRQDTLADDLAGAGDQAHAVAPVTLGLIERRVGLGKRRLEHEAARRRGGDAERDRHGAALDRGRADGLAQLLGDLAGERRAHAGEQHDELLAAEPVDRLERPQRGAQAVGDLLEHGVADGVAVLVVDRLEAVDVADDERDLFAGHAGLVLELGQARRQRRTVKHPGEPVDNRGRARLGVEVADARSDDRRADDRHQRVGQDRRAVEEVMEFETEGDRQYVGDAPGRVEADDPRREDDAGQHHRHDHDRQQEQPIALGQGDAGGERELRRHPGADQ